MDQTLPLLLPLVAALLYVVGALLIKRSSDFGVGVWRKASSCRQHDPLRRHVGGYVRVVRCSGTEVVASVGSRTTPAGNARLRCGVQCDVDSIFPRTAVGDLPLGMAVADRRVRVHRLAVACVRHGDCEVSQCDIGKRALQLARVVERRGGVDHRALVYQSGAESRLEHAGLAASGRRANDCGNRAGHARLSQSGAKIRKLRSAKPRHGGVRHELGSMGT